MWMQLKTVYGQACIRCIVYAYMADAGVAVAAVAAAAVDDDDAFVAFVDDEDCDAAEVPEIQEYDAIADSKLEVESTVAWPLTDQN